MDTNVIPTRLAQMTYQFKVLFKATLVLTVGSLLSSLFVAASQATELRSTLYTLHVAACLALGSLFWMLYGLLTCSQMADRAKERPEEFKKLPLSIIIFFVGAHLLILLNFATIGSVIVSLSAELLHLKWEWIFLPGFISSLAVSVCVLGLWN